MNLSPNINFPGGSKQRVSRAGDRVRKGHFTFEDVQTIDLWRAAHKNVLNTFQAILRTRTRGTKIVVAQRHKRQQTIFDKLKRFPRMQLARMDDVAGCRLIFPSIQDLYDFRDKVHAAHFKHKLKNEKDKYDYIKRPKETGYRGVHDIYEYNVNSIHGQKFQGLLIEIQYRTIYQHAWATCVEVIGFITENQPKFEQGDTRYQEILAISSEIISRVFEESRSCLSEISDNELVQRFLKLDHQLHFMRTLRSLNAANSDVSSKKNVILIFSESSDLQVKTYRNATDALRDLFELEKQHPGKDIVLVKADSSEEVRIAFRNYFSDAKEFIDLIDKGCQTLTRDKVRYY